MAAATADFILSGLALSGSVVLGNRNFYWCGMGQRVLGKLLGLGPERSLGSDYFHALWNGFSCAKSPSFQKSVLFHWFLIVSFSAILMTYFGVNYILGGMHSYAG